MRYEVQKWDGNAWSTITFVQGHSDRNALKASGLKGKLRALPAGQHWNARHDSGMGRPDPEMISPISPPKALPSRSRVTSKDREYRSHERRDRRLKVVVLSHPSRLEQNYVRAISQSNDSPVRHANREVEGPGTGSVARIVPNGHRLPPILRWNKDNERSQF